MKLFGGKKDTSRDVGRAMRLTERPEATPAPPSFRRNRTMTDRSAVPEVSERARIHHLRLLRRKVGMILGLSLGLLALIILGVSQFTHSVTVTASGSTEMVQRLDAATYQKYFDEYYQAYPFERFRFLTNYDQLSHWMQASAPELASITPKGIAGLGVARFELRLRQPLAGWRVNDQQYYVDTQGVTFKKNYYPEPTVTVVDHSGAEVEQGAAIASSRLLSFVGRAVALTADEGVTITQVEIPSRSMRQVYLHGESIPVIRMTIDRGVEYQVMDMKKALAFFQARGESPEYIDVRTSGKAFYR